MSESPAEMVEELRRREQQVLRRLRDGEAKIARAQSGSRGVEAWEDLWISLLREYEAIYDALRAVAA